MVAGVQTCALPIYVIQITDEVGDGGEFPAVGYSAAVTPVQRGLYAVALGLRF